MTILVTGGAGFIGSNLVNYLHSKKILDNKTIDKIVVIDNLSLGKKEFIKTAIAKGVDFYNLDLFNFEETLKIFQKYRFDLVFHLSANSDISYGFKKTDWDLKQGTLVTYNILECMRLTGVKKIIFSSTSAIYGEASISSISEDYGPLLPISFYGASKLACEGLISAFCHNYNIQSLIYRFANIVGRNSTHGILVDFIKKLKYNPNKLEVLGDGNQTKTYLYIDDCIEGILFGFANLKNQISFYNLACENVINVNKIAEIVIEAFGYDNLTTIEYAGGERGWSGDVPQVKLSPIKLKKLGWVAKLNSEQAIRKAVVDLL